MAASEDCIAVLLSDCPSDDFKRATLEFSALVNSLSDEEINKFVEDGGAAKLLSSIEASVWDEHAQASISALCALAVDEATSTALVANGVHEILCQFMDETGPTQESEKKKPKLTDTDLALLLAGKKPATNQSDMTAEQRAYVDTQALRRTVVLALRNLATASNGPNRDTLGRYRNWFPFIVKIMTNPFDNGLVVFHALACIRLVVTRASSELREHIRPLLTADIEVESVPGKVAVLNLMQILTSVARISRVVQQPSGEKLWVHTEATRTLAILARWEDLAPVLVECAAARPIADMMVGTTSPILHEELVGALDSIFRVEGQTQRALAPCKPHVAMALVTVLARCWQGARASTAAQAEKASALLRTTVSLVLLLVNADVDGDERFGDAVAAKEGVRVMETICTLEGFTADEEALELLEKLQHCEQPKEGADPNGCIAM